ncbi:MAG: S1C family serine protease [Dehalococcoidia bacterium]
MSEAGNALVELSEGIASAVERAAGWTVLVAARRRIPASGVVWGAGGVIVTADHAVEQDEDIRLLLPDERETTAELVGRDPSTDLAVLRAADAASVAPAEQVPADEVRVGQIALAVGRPGRGGVQASMGVVSAIGRPQMRRRRGPDALVRSDATLFPGFSGGPLIDASGRAIGVNTSRFRPHDGVTIPTAVVSRVVGALLANGRIRRAYLGIGSHAVPLQAALASKAGGQESGLLIVSVEAGAAAESAGVLVGDILVSVAGEAVRGTEDLQTALASELVGAEVRLGILRGGEPVELQATLGERP